MSMRFSNSVVSGTPTRTISVEKWGGGTHKAIAMDWRERAEKVS